MNKWLQSLVLHESIKVAGKNNFFLVASYFKVMAKENDKNLGAAVNHTV